MTLSIFDQALNRFYKAVRDAGAFVNELNMVTKHVHSWRVKIKTIDQEKLGAIQEAIDSLRVELRAMAEEMEVSEAHLKEFEEGAEDAADKLATGAHMLHPENRKYLEAGDAVGMAEFLLNIDPAFFRQAVKRAKKAAGEEKLLGLLQVMKGELREDDYP